MPFETDVHDSTREEYEPTSRVGMSVEDSLPRAKRIGTFRNLHVGAHRRTNRNVPSPSLGRHQEWCKSQRCPRSPAAMQPSHPGQVTSMQPYSPWDEALPSPSTEGLYGTVLCKSCGFFGIGVEHPEWCSWEVLKARSAEHSRALSVVELGVRAAAYLDAQPD